MGGPVLRHGFSDRRIKFDVEPVWDSETATCRMMVGKEILEAWRISQRALEGLEPKPTTPPAFDAFVRKVLAYRPPKDDGKRRR